MQAMVGSRGPGLAVFTSFPDRLRVVTECRGPLMRSFAQLRWPGIRMYDLEHPLPRCSAGQKDGLQTLVGRGCPMRFEFIVKDAVPGDVAVELPELRRTSYPTGGTSPFGPRTRRSRRPDPPRSP